MAWARRGTEPRARDSFRQLAGPRAGCLAVVRACRITVPYTPPGGPRPGAATSSGVCALGQHQHPVEPSITRIVRRQLLLSEGFHPGPRAESWKSTSRSKEISPDRGVGGEGGQTRLPASPVLVAGSEHLVDIYYCILFHGDPPAPYPQVLFGVSSTCAKTSHRSAERRRGAFSGLLALGSSRCRARRQVS